MVGCKYYGQLNPAIRPFVEELFDSELFPQLDLDIVTPLSGLPLSDSYRKDEGECDRFKLILPFAGYSIVWEIIFNGACPSAPPDFIFDDESFLCECDLNCIQSLVCWDASVKKSLIHVISDLLKLYSQYQFLGVERSVGPFIQKWLDIENVEKDGFKVQILNGSQKSSPYSILSRQGSTTLQNGATSVLVEVPVSTDLFENKNLQFSVQYIFKSHTRMYEEKISCSPELEGWLRSYADSFKKRNRWNVDSTTLSEIIQSRNKDITDLFCKSVKEFKTREALQLSLYHNIMSKNELNPIVLEFDFKEFLFSSYLIQDDKYFAVDLDKGTLRGRLCTLADNCSFRQSRLVPKDILTPDFDIAKLLRRYDP